jgi:hypothetical protein
MRNWFFSSSPLSKRNTASLSLLISFKRQKWIRTSWNASSDEKWVYECDLETKHQSLYWKSRESPRPTKGNQVCSKVKHILIFFYIEGLVHHEYIPEGQVVNQHYCFEVLKLLRLAVCCKRPKKWESRVDSAV